MGCCASQAADTTAPTTSATSTSTTTNRVPAPTTLIATAVVQHRDATQARSAEPLKATEAPKGVSIQILRELHAANLTNDRPPRWTTEEFFAAVIAPATEMAHCAYIELPAANGAAAFTERRTAAATHYIVHCWTDPFAWILEVAEAAAIADPTAYFWIDILCLPAPQLTPVGESTAICMAAVQQLHVVVNPLSPQLLAQERSVLEIGLAMALDKVIVAHMPRDLQSEFSQKVAADFALVLAAYQQVSSTSHVNHFADVRDYLVSRVHEQALVLATQLEKDGALITAANIYALVADYVSGESKRSLWANTLTLRQKSLGKHEDTARAYLQLGLAVTEVDESAAEQFMTLALAMAKDTVGDLHLLTADIYDELGQLFRGPTRDNARGQTMYEHALAIRRALQGDSHPLTARTLLKLGDTFFFRQQHEHAITYFRESLATFARCPPPAAPDFYMLMAANHAELCCGALENHNEQLAIQQQALAYLLSFPTAAAVNHSDEVLKFRERIVSSATDAQKYDVAIEQGEILWGGTSDEDVKANLGNKFRLLRLYIKGKRHEQVLYLLDKYYTQFIKHSLAPELHLLMLKATTLAEFVERYEEAQQLFRSIIAQHRAQNDLQDLARVLYLEGDMHDSRDNFLLAAKAFDEAQKIFAKLYGNQDKNTIDANRRLMNVMKRSVGRPNGARSEDSYTLVLSDIRAMEFTDFDLFTSEGRFKMLEFGADPTYSSFVQGEQLEADNMEAAIRLYRTAANSDFAPAMEKIADLFENGHGLQQSKISAALWLQRAAKLNSVKAVLRLNGFSDPSQELSSFVRDRTLDHRWQNRSATSSVAEDPLGVSVAVLRHIKRASFQLGAITTTEACQRFIQPATINKAYIELLFGLEDEEHIPLVSRATHFLSHAWAFDIDTVVDVAESIAQEKPGTYFWFDLVTNSQHQTAERPFEWWKTTFRDSIAAIGSVVVVLSPWQDPLPLTRAWCLWEIFSAIELPTVALEVRLPSWNAQEFLVAVQADVSAVLNTVMRVDTERAAASKPSDLQRIRQAILSSTGGYQHVNEVVKQKLRTCLIAQALLYAQSTVKDGDEKLRILSPIALAISSFEPVPALQLLEACTKISGSSPIQQLRVANLMIHMTELLVDQQDYIKADLCLEKARELFESCHMQNSLDGSAYYHALGMLLVRSGHASDAIKPLEVAIGIREKAVADLEAERPVKHWQGTSKGSEDDANLTNPSSTSPESDLHLARVNLAASYEILGAIQLEGVSRNALRALELYERALRIKIACFGEIPHPRLATSYNNIGIVFSLLHRYEEAVQMYLKSLNIKKATLGVQHASNISCHANLAVCFANTNKFAEAEESLLQALAISVKNFGEQHPQTKQLNELLALARKRAPLEA